MFRGVHSVMLVALVGALVVPKARAQAPSIGGTDLAGLGDGALVRADQFPPFLTPTHEGEFGFDEVVVLGDHPILHVERPDPDGTAEVVRETWNRVQSTEVGGRAVSVFRLAWPAAALREGFRLRRWGVDRPSLEWGEVSVPSVSASTARTLHLRIVPSNIRDSTVVQVDDTTQYASHAVNLVAPGFGDDRVSGAEDGLDLVALTRRFYERFEDDYDVLAVVTRSDLFLDAPGVHQLVRNDVDGLGIPRVDESARYGSRGGLAAVEVYATSAWATQRGTLHQLLHRWGDYSRVWDALGIARAGHRPDVHTPLLASGEVMAGAVLEATRRVRPDGTGGHVIERSLPMTGFHPLTLYRMGLIPVEDVPDLTVFVEQGQFGSTRRSVPAVGTSVRGATVRVRATDIVAADGERVGPVADRVRRAVIYVTRDGLASASEMDVVNFYAARLAELDGITSWDQYPSFFEATGGRARLATEVIPRDGVGSGRVDESPGRAFLDVAADALTGLSLDTPIPGRIDVGDTVEISGIVTADDRDDFTIICLRFIRYGASDANEVFVCSSLAGNRFSVDVTFGEHQRGSYTVEPFLFWSGAPGQLARSRYGVITVR